ncbi:MAG: helix-turn-helix transcriptional regulator [Elusimicrobiota bacterium]
MEYNEMLKLLGTKIMSLRKRLGYTQEMLAEKVNVHPTFISQIEHGQKGMSLDVLLKVSDTLNTTISSLFDFQSLHTNKSLGNSVINTITDLLKETSDGNIDIVYNLTKDLIRKKKK